MKVIVLGDTHMGARGGAVNFAHYFNRFFTESLYPYMLEHGIIDIYQLGDLFDNRTALPLKSFHISEPEWFGPLVEHGFTMHTLLGNHDITLRESLKINTTESALKKYIESGHVVVYKEPTAVHVDDNCTFDIVPWICKENFGEVGEFLKRKNISDICLGHFAVEGASMYRGIPAQSGMNQNLFERYERVFTGHYHTRSELMDGKIQYVGTPYEITWMDAHDPRGFTVFDTVTRKFEFVPNPETIFQKILYRGNETSVPSGLKGKYLKIVVEQKEDTKKFEAYVNSIRMQIPEDIIFIENLDDWKDGSIDDDDSIDIDDTVTVIAKYIQSLDITANKDLVSAYVNGLFIEAVAK